MPIKDSAGDVLGTLALYGPRPRRPLPEHLTLMEDGARLAGIAIERHRAFERLVHDARHDGLSGLPNRTAIFESLDEAIVRNDAGASVAVLFVDLDGLKTLNDTLGHDRADEMIREVGQRLANAVRSTDFVGRFGGDEFIVVAEEMRNEEEASKLGFRLLDAISQPLSGIDSTVLTASIGIAMIGGTGSDAREGIRRADSAMYEAKRAGGDRMVFYRGSHRVREGRRLALARELRGAELARRATSSCSSPYSSSVPARSRRSRRSCAGTAQPSARSPQPSSSRSPRTPARSSRSEPGCSARAARPSRGSPRRTGRELELSVNVSAHQIAHPGFARSVRLTLAHAEFSPEQLTLEITETALIGGDEVIARTLRELESHGIRIVLDDFGTGVSSLSWLKEHPVGALKIDRGFISGLADDVRDQAIVSSLIGMSRALGCTVTAEGVETDEQLDALRALDCERVQGFLLARPLPAAELEGLLVSDNVVAIRPPAATNGPADPRQTARTRRPLERAPGQSHHPAVLRLPASR